VGLYSGGFWLFLLGVLGVVTLLGGAYPSFVLARVPPIEALRIGRTKVGREVRHDGARGRAVRRRELLVDRRVR